MPKPTNPLPLMLKPPTSLTDDKYPIYKRAYVLGISLSLGGWGGLSIRRKGLKQTTLLPSPFRGPRQEHARIQAGRGSPAQRAVRGGGRQLPHLTSSWKAGFDHDLEPGGGGGKANLKWTIWGGRTGVQPRQVVWGLGPEQGPLATIKVLFGPLCLVSLL